MATYYLKYRPGHIKDLDLVSARKSLEKILKKESIPHALLFSGPKGTGKTSAARLLAKSINCENSNTYEPCGKCTQCKTISNGSNIDVVEIDAASHRGIDDVRVLRDAVGLVPVSAKKKIYIIDEAHMLTTEASNALLKTLEEPPDHVVFVLATTNPEKLISTIRSRVTTIEFNKANQSEIIASLKKIVKGEKLKTNDQTLKLIANESDGSFRDAHKILEQLVWEEIDLADSTQVIDILKNKSENYAVKIISSLENKDAEAALMELDKSAQAGVQTKDVLENIIDVIHNKLSSKFRDDKKSQNIMSEVNTKDLLSMIELFSDAYSKLPNSYIESIPVEVAIIRWCEDLDEPKKKAKNKISKNLKKKANKSKNKDSKLKTDAKDVVHMSENGNVDDVFWNQLLSKLKPINTSTETLLRSVNPISFDGKTLSVSVFYKFHKEKLEDSNHRHLLEDVISEMVGNKVNIECKLAKTPFPVNTSEGVQNTKDQVVLADSADNVIENIAEDIFGN